MARVTGTYRTTVVGGEKINAFIPNPLPPKDPPLVIAGDLARLHAEALAAIEKLAVAGTMVPSADWFLYGFVRKEAVISSQIEGTQATLMDVLTYEATKKADRPSDVEEVCNYVDALAFARAEIAKPKGLPLSMRLLCGAHKRLMHGTRGADKHPGAVRTVRTGSAGPAPETRCTFHRPQTSCRRPWRTLNDGFTGKTPSLRLSVPGLPMSSSRPSTRSWTGTAASGGCSSRCSWSTGGS